MTPFSPPRRAASCRRRTLAMLAALAVLVPQAASAGVDDEPWHATLMPYEWLALTTGHITVDDRTFSSNGTANIESVWAIGGYAEVGKSWLGLFTDVYYAYEKLGGTTEIAGPLGHKSLTISSTSTSRLLLAQYGFVFRLAGQHAVNRSTWGGLEMPPSFDFYVGARTVNVGEQISANRIQNSETGTFNSPMLGARGGVDLGPRWNFNMDANIGGFNTGDVNSAWEVTAAFDYRFHICDVPATVRLAARALGTNLSGNEGRLTINSIAYGPLIGLSMNW
jgi:hypothetical protein